MSSKSKKSERLTIRLEENLMVYVTEQAIEQETSPADFVRFLIRRDKHEGR